MQKASVSSGLVWLGVMVCLGVSLGVSGCSRRVNSGPGSGAMAPARAMLQEIHVDQSCHILQDQVDGVQGMAVPGIGAAAPGVGSDGQGFQMDSAVCHLESVPMSSHVKETIVNGVTQRSTIVVSEQEYLLQDVLQEPVAFVVEQQVPEGWRVDSEPQPTKMVGQTAVFRVMAEPGQIVRLHVGVQHAIPMAAPADTSQ